MSFDFTEADEQATSLAGALARFKEQAFKAVRGLETHAVADMYELTAIRAGATSNQIQEIWDSVKKLANDWPTC